MIKSAILLFPKNNLNFHIIQRREIHAAVILCARLCIATQNLSIGVNVVSEGSPSRIFKVLLISLGITILPKASTLLTIPVAFIYLSPFRICRGEHRSSACWTSHCGNGRPMAAPTIILQITMLLFVRQGDLYERLSRFFHLLSECEKSQIPRPISLISPEKQSIIFLNKPEVPRFRIVTSSQKS